MQGSTKVSLEHLKFENIQNFKDQKNKKKNKQKIIPTCFVSLALKKLHKFSFNDHSFKHTHTLITTPNQPVQDFAIKHLKGGNP